MAKTEETIKMITTGSALRVLKVEDIQTDPAYQRVVREGHKKIVAEFDKNAFGVPLVAQREDGTLWVVDGLQRLTALRKMEKKEVRAEVFKSSGPEHEANVFKIVNLNRTKLSSPEIFKAKLTSGDQSAWKLKETVEKCGYVIAYQSHSAGRAQDAKYISAINSLERVAERFGYEYITIILEITKEVWSEDKYGASSDIINGMAAFLHARKGVIDKNRLIVRLAKTTPAKIIYSGNLGVGSRGNNIAEVLERIYRRRNA